MSASTHRRMGQFVKRTLAVFLVAVLLVGAWYLRSLLLLIFAAVLVGCLLWSIATLISKFLRFPHPASFALACLILVLVTGGFIALAGAQLRGQLADLWQQLPELLVPFENTLGIPSIEDWLAERVEAMLNQTSVISRIAGLSSAAAGILANIALVIVAAFYFAWQPQLYVRGLVRLFPPPMRGRAEATLANIGDGLRYWLVGQVIAMLIVALLTYAGLSLLGIPSALALAVIAGMLEFVPFLGPIIAAIPAIALGLAEGPNAAIYVGVLYLAIQQLEGNIITPVVHRQTVHLPPAVTLFGILASGLAFGWLGVLLATPLAVVLMILVKDLWVARLEEDAGDEP